MRWFADALAYKMPYVGNLQCTAMTKTPSISIDSLDVMVRSQVKGSREVGVLGCPVVRDMEGNVQYCVWMCYSGGCFTRAEPEASAFAYLDRVRPSRSSVDTLLWHVSD